MAGSKTLMGWLAVGLLWVCVTFASGDSPAHPRANFKGTRYEKTNTDAQALGSDPVSEVDYVDGPLAPLYDFLIQRRLQRFCKLLRDAGLEQVIKDLGGSWTLFAPTDASFIFLPGGTLEDLQRNPQLLRDFILYHFAVGDFPSTQIQNEMLLDSAQGSPLRFNIYGPLMTVSGAQILEPDLVFEMGRVHIIDRPLYPIPSSDSLTYLQRNHREFYKLLVDVGLIDYINSGTFTFLVPDDQAFGYLSVELKDALKTNVSLAERIVLNHILPGSIYVGGITNGMQWDTVAGSPVTFTVKRGLTFADDTPIVLPDVSLTNGVVHVLNRVLLPDGIEADCQCKPSRETGQTSGQVSGRFRPPSGPARPQYEQGTTLRPGQSGTIQTPRPIAGQPPSSVGTPGQPGQTGPQGRPVTSPGQTGSRPWSPSRTGQPVQPIPPPNQVTRSPFLPQPPSDDDNINSVIGTGVQPDSEQKRPDQTRTTRYPPLPPQRQRPATQPPSQKVGPRGETYPGSSNEKSPEQTVTPGVPQTTRQTNKWSNQRPPSQRYPTPQQGSYVTPTTRRPLTTRAYDWNQPRITEPALEQPNGGAAIDSSSGNQGFTTQRPTVQTTSWQQRNKIQQTTRQPYQPPRQPSLPSHRTTTLRPSYGRPTPSPQVPSNEQPFESNRQSPNCRRLGDRITSVNRNFPVCSEQTPDGCQNSPYDPLDPRPLCPESEGQDCRDPNTPYNPSDNRPLCPSPVSTQDCREFGQPTYVGDRRPLCTTSSVTQTGCKDPSAPYNPSDRRPVCRTTNSQNTPSPPNQGSSNPQGCRKSDEIANPQDQRPLCPEEPNEDCRPLLERPTPGDRRPVCKSGSQPGLKPTKDVDKHQKKPNKPQQPTYPQTGQYPTQTTRRQSWQSTTRSPQSWQTSRQPAVKQPQPGSDKPSQPDENSFQTRPQTGSSQTQTGSYPTGSHGGQNPSQPQSEIGSSRTPTGADLKPEVGSNVGTPTGNEPSQTQTGSYPSQPQSGRYPSQTQSGRYPSQPQSGRYPSQPQTGRYPSQPQTGRYPSQPQVGTRPSHQQPGSHTSPPQSGSHPSNQPGSGSYPSSQPESGSYPSQEQPGSHPSQPHTGGHPSQPQTGSSPSQAPSGYPPSGTYPSGSPQSGVYPSQPQRGSYPSQQPGSLQPGSQPSQPETGSYPSQQPGTPQTGSYPSQPQSGTHSSQPHSGVQPSQPQAGSPDSSQPSQGQFQPGRPSPGYPQRRPGSQQTQTQSRFTTTTPQPQTQGVSRPGSSDTRWGQPATQSRPTSGQTTGPFAISPRRPTSTPRVPISVTGTSTTPGEDSRRTLYEIVEEPALLIRGRPVQLTRIFELFHKAGIQDILNEPGPTTVFLPSDDAFALLPKGVVEQLEENPELLRQILLYHVTKSEILPSSQTESYTVPSVEGNQLVITMLNGGRLIFVSGAKAVAVTRANNGIFYVINQLLYPLPHHDIVGAIQSRPDLSTLAYLLPLSGLEDMLRGQTPYTFLAPTDNAFAQLSQPVYDELTRNTTALQEILLNHIIEGAHYGREFFTGGTFPSARGGKLKFQVVSYGYQVNDVNIKTPEIVTGTGVIHLVDQVLLENPDLQFFTSLENSLSGGDDTLPNSQPPSGGFGQPGRPSSGIPGPDSNQRLPGNQLTGLTQPQIGGLQPPRGQPTVVGRLPASGQGPSGNQPIAPGQPQGPSFGGPRQPSTGTSTHGQHTPGQPTGTFGNPRQPSTGTSTHGQQTPGQHAGTFGNPRQPSTGTSTHGQQTPGQPAGTFGNPRQPTTGQSVHGQQTPGQPQGTFGNPRQPSTGTSTHGQQTPGQPTGTFGNPRQPSIQGRQPALQPGQQTHGQQTPGQSGLPSLGGQRAPSHGQRTPTTAFNPRQPAGQVEYQGPGSGSFQPGGQPHDVAELARSMGLNQFANWITNTGLLEKIHDGGVYTVFAPTDEAVDSLPQEMSYSIQSDPEQVKSILQYHIIPQRLNLNSVTNEETASTLLQGKTIRFNVYQNSLPDCKQLVTASGTPVGEALATMGSIQVIPVQQVLYQPAGNLLKIVEASPILQKLSEAVRTARVSWVLTGVGPMTIFAPSDTAFNSLTEDQKKTLIEDKQAFSDLLKRHIVRGTFFSSGIQEDLEKKSENNKPVNLSLQEGVLTVNSVPVTYSDITATNGVLHVIDHFL